MSFAEEWGKEFCDEFKRQKIDDWGIKLRKQSATAWTYRIVEFLRNLAQKMGYQQEYEIGADFSWYKEGSTSPSVAIEHENTYSLRAVWDDEVVKLCENNAPLKVLITYVDKSPEEKKLIKKFQEEIHRKRINEPTTKQANEEFLFMIGYSQSPIELRYYIFYSTGELKEFRC